MKNLHIFIGIGCLALAGIVYAMTDSEVSKYQSEYDRVAIRLTQLTQKRDDLNLQIESTQRQLGHIQCMLAESKKSRNMEVSQASEYCFQ